MPTNTAKKPSLSSSPETTDIAKFAISGSEISDLRSKLTALRNQQKKLAKLNSDLRAEEHRLVGEIPLGSQREESVRASIAMNRHRDGTIADLDKRQLALKEAAAELFDFAESIRLRRAEQIMALYDATVAEMARAIRRYVEDEVEAQDLARASSVLQFLHQRAFNMTPFATNKVERAASIASAVLRDLEEPLPTFAAS